MVEVYKKFKNGVEYTNYRATKTARALCCVGDNRIVIIGKPKITKTKGSIKFGEEIQFSLTCKKGFSKIESRNPSEWDTIEINLPKELGLELIKKVYEKELKK